MEENLRKVLEEGICRIDVSLDTPEVYNRLQRLYDEITLFNPSYGLVNADGRELVVRHILDCLAPVPIFNEIASPAGKTLADLGSGSGLPGLVLSSALECASFSLVERMGRRAGFLRNTIAMMGLNQKVNVVQKDLSEVQDCYDIITFRAFRPFKDIISDVDRILCPGGMILAYKSSDENINEELEVLKAYGEEIFKVRIVDYEVPFLDAKRSLLILSRQL